MILFYFQLIQYTEYNLAHRGLDLAIIIRILLLYLYNLHKIAVPKQSDSFIHSHTGVRCFHKYKYQVLSCPYFYKHKFVILNINLTQILLSYSLLVLLLLSIFLVSQHTKLNYPPLHSTNGSMKLWNLTGSSVILDVCTKCFGISYFLLFLPYTLALIPLLTQ